MSSRKGAYTNTQILLNAISLILARLGNFPRSHPRFIHMGLVITHWWLFGTAYCHRFFQNLVVLQLIHKKNQPQNKPSPPAKNPTYVSCPVFIWKDVIVIPDRTSEPEKGLKISKTVFQQKSSCYFIPLDTKCHRGFWDQPCHHRDDWNAETSRGKGTAVGDRSESRDGQAYHI